MTKHKLNKYIYTYKPYNQIDYLAKINIHRYFSSTFLLYISVAGPVEADPEYQLIVEANNITVEIDNEISKSLQPIMSSVLYRNVVIC